MFHFTKWVSKLPLDKFGIRDLRLTVVRGNLRNVCAALMGRDNLAQGVEAKLQALGLTLVATAKPCLPAIA